MDKPPLKTRWGALPDDWATLDLTLGIGSDLLPVVSNPSAEISPRSSMKQLGKTPSRYDKDRQVVGIPQWTDYQASDNEIARWASEPDYGICIQTRLMRAIDIDVEDAATALAIEGVVEAVLGAKLPKRWRADSAKCLLAFTLEGEFPKRVIRCAAGIIEFLGNGQQFIAHGTHPKGARYEWSPGMAAPSITVSLFEQLWSELEAAFGVEPSRTSAKTSASSMRGERLDIEDPVADWLDNSGHVLSETRRGALVIECPWQHEHSSGEAGDTSTVWFRAGTNGHTQGHFRCQHAHCEHRNRSDFLAAVGYQEDLADEFEDLGPDTELSGVFDDGAESSGADPFAVIPAHVFAAQPSGGYIIEDVIPDADIGMIYGGSTDGKTFVMLDMSMAVARGVPWRGKKVKQGKVVYIVAEGGGGFRKRLKAYAIHNQVKLEDIPFGVIHTAPNLLDATHVKKICASIEQNGARLIVVDTFAQTTPGANENAGEHVGKAIANIRSVGRKVGAMVILVHHTGKDASRGARGWSGLRAASDFELEVVRDGENRMINTTKQKDGDDTESWGFKLLQVPISMDDDGKVITSCVIVENDVPVDAGVNGGKQKAKTPGKKLGEWEQAILDVHAELSLGGDVLKSELILRAAERRPDKGTLRDRKKNVGHALKGLRQGKESILLPHRVEDGEDKYVVLRS